MADPTFRVRRSERRNAAWMECMASDAVEQSSRLSKGSAG